MPARKVSLHVKVSPELHMALKMIALTQSQTIGELVEQTVRDNISSGWIERAEDFLRQQGKLD